MEWDARFLRQDGPDTLIRVRVTPKSARNAVVGVKNGCVLLAVHAAPADGAANAAIIAVLSAFFGCSRSQIQLVRGHKSREKIVRISGWSVAQIAEKLDALF